MQLPCKPALGIEPRRIGYRPIPAPGHDGVALSESAIRARPTCFDAALIPTVRAAQPGFHTLAFAAIAALPFRLGFALRTEIFLTALGLSSFGNGNSSLVVAVAFSNGL